jgi:hypothetical protein
MPASAHSPICNCYDNGDGTVTCEGGFSDGASAAGVAIRVVDARDRVLIDGKMNDSSSFSFAKPDQEFHIVFDAGQSHIVTIFGEDIE